MDSHLIELQQALRQQNEDLRDELSALEKWEREVEEKEVSKRKKMIQDDLPALPPIRGTVASLKAHQQKTANSSSKQTKEDPIQIAKEQGNEYFKQGKLEDAVRLYTKGIDLDPDSSTTHVLYANRAMCYLKQKEFEKAERDASKCVQMNRGYVKAFYRRALARKELKKYKDARGDLETVLALQPGDNDAEVELRAVTQLIREENKKAELGSAAPARKKIVIAEVEDDDEGDEESASPKDDEPENPAEIEARQKRIERDMDELEAKRNMEETKRRIAAEKEESERQRTRRTHDRVEIIEDDDEPQPQPVKSVVPPTVTTDARKSESGKREGSQTTKSTPVPRNLKVEWSKETIKAPKNFTEFERIYKDVRDDNELFDVLISAVPASLYKTVFAVNLTPELLMDILKSACRGTGVRATELIDALSTLSRVGELAMFFDDAEREVLKSALHLVQSSGASASQMSRFRKAFEL